MAALLIGYARCSTDQQDLTAQHDWPQGTGLSRRPVIYVNHGLTGTTRDRPALREAMAACREGDTLGGVTKLDRLAPVAARRAGRSPTKITRPAQSSHRGFSLGRRAIAVLVRRGPGAVSARLDRFRAALWHQ